MVEAGRGQPRHPQSQQQRAGTMDNDTVRVRVTSSDGRIQHEHLVPRRMAEAAIKHCGEGWKMEIVEDTAR